MYASLSAVRYESLSTLLNHAYATLTKLAFTKYLKGV